MDSNSGQPTIQRAARCCVWRRERALATRWHLHGVVQGPKPTRDVAPDDSARSDKGPVKTGGIPIPV
jgi:hypothetical protein